jgi:hypothetical protein
MQRAAKLLLLLSALIFVADLAKPALSREIQQETQA